MTTHWNIPFLMAKLTKEARDRGRRKTNWIRRFREFRESLLAYVSVVAGVIAREYSPLFTDALLYGKKGITIELPTKWQVLVACVVGFIVVVRSDKGDAEGKRRAWKRRAAYYFGFGFMWRTLLGSSG